MLEVKNRHLSLIELVEATKKHLVKLEYSSETIKMYTYIWNCLIAYARKAGVCDYTLKFGKEFIKNHYGFPDGKISKVKHRKKIRAIQILYDFKVTGDISKRKKIRNYLPPENFKEIFSNYFKLLKETNKSWDSIRPHKAEVIKFLEFINKSKVKKFSDIESEHVVKYMLTKNSIAKSTKSSVFSILRLFLKFTFERSYHLKDLSLLVPPITYNKRSTIPSVFSYEEILKTLGSIDRKTPEGKRDYAIFLLAVKLGMRSFDICHLEFKDLKWQNNQIRFIQSKTGREIILPLSNEIGKAIIDYLKNGRPGCKSRYVFIRHAAPHDFLTNGATHSMVEKYLRMANINLEGRHHGIHALRHSLAGRLLENDVPMPVISAVLGHSSIEATNIYLKIDIAQLRKCSLEVPVYGS